MIHPTSATQSSAVEPAFAELLDEISTALVAGQAVDLERLVAEHPEHADQLRQVVPTL